MNSITQILIPVLTIVSTVSGALAALLLGSQKALRTANADLRARNGDLESRVVRLEAAAQADKEKIRILTELVRGDDRLEKIEVSLNEQSELLTEHHNEAIATWTMMIRQLEGRTR